MRDRFDKFSHAKLTRADLSGNLHIILGNSEVVFHKSSSGSENYVGLVRLHDLTEMGHYFTNRTDFDKKIIGIYPG